MDDDNTLIWSHRHWRCQRRRADDGKDWLELFEGEKVALTRPVRDGEQLQAIANSWRDALDDASPELVMPEPTRRRLGSRRHSTRGGRRAGDC